MKSVKHKNFEYIYDPADLKVNSEYGWLKLPVKIKTLEPVSFTRYSQFGGSKTRVTENIWGRFLLNIDPNAKKIAAHSNDRVPKLPSGDQWEIYSLFPSNDIIGDMLPDDISRQIFDSLPKFRKCWEVKNRSLNSEFTLTLGKELNLGGWHTPSLIISTRFIPEEKCTADVMLPDHGSQRECFMVICSSEETAQQIVKEAQLGYGVRKIIVQKDGKALITVCADYFLPQYNGKGLVPAYSDAVAKFVEMLSAEVSRTTGLIPKFGKEEN